jgi:hypothetical protein
MFRRIHSNHLPSGGINVIVLGDLGQLPPMDGEQVFRSLV